VLTVGADGEDVERRLAGGGLACPPCGGVLARWGRARERLVRGRDGGVSRLRPRRARCRGCGRTHVLLPVTCLARRADETGVIGTALEAKAAGAGTGRSRRRWAGLTRRCGAGCRAFAARAEQVRSAFTALAAGLVADPPLPAPAGSALGDAVAAVAAAAAVVCGLPGVGSVARWHLAAAVTSGMLLAPSWPGTSANASWPWAGGV